MYGRLPLDAAALRPYIIHTAKLFTTDDDELVDNYFFDAHDAESRYYRAALHDGQGHASQLERATP